MSEIRYMISDASKQIDVEPHVLRYWEEELCLEIPRNEMGHRYYRDQDIKLIKTIKALKEQGFQLKAIKLILPEANKIENLDPQGILRLKEELNGKVEDVAMEDEGLEEIAATTLFEEETKEMNDSVDLVNCDKQGYLANTENDKMGQFKEIMSKLIVEALRENNVELSSSVSQSVSDNVLKEMDYLMRMKEEQEEERFKRLDETIRGYQKSRHEIAATSNKEKKMRKKLFGKK